MLRLSEDPRCNLVGGGFPWQGKLDRKMNGQANGGPRRPHWRAQSWVSELYLGQNLKNSLEKGLDGEQDIRYLG